MTDNRYGKIHTDGSRSGGQPLNDSIEAKALALVNEVAKECWQRPDEPYSFQIFETLCCAIEQQEVLTAENERLRGTLLWIRGICAEELDLEYTDAMRRVFQRNVRDAVLKALTNPEAGQPWLRTYDEHLKGEGNDEHN